MELTLEQKTCIRTQCSVPNRTGFNLDSYCYVLFPTAFSPPTTTVRQTKLFIISEAFGGNKPDLLQLPSLPELRAPSTK